MLSSSPFAQLQKRKNAPNVAISVVIGLGMLIAGAVRLFLGPTPEVNAILLGAIVGASVPLGIELVREIFKGNLSVDVLAAISIITAVLLHEYWVAAIVILMLSGGKTLEDFATRRASSVLSALSRRMPQVAHRLNPNGAVDDVPIADVRVGDPLLVYPHELCPVDGVVLTGHGNMDEAFLTGEPFLIAKAPGTAVISGAINGAYALTIQATRLAVDSRYARIVQVLHASEENRPKIRRIGDRLSSWYAPGAILIALASWLISGQSERFLAVLVIATPCPLLIAIPVAVIGAISVGARFGILIKDPSILEKIDTCETLIVDKTGTLTYGKPSLTSITPLTAWSENEVLAYAASLERYSKHPLASAVVEGARAKVISIPEAQDVSEPAGEALSGHVGGHAIALTGRSRLTAEIQSDLPAIGPGLECIVLIDGSPAAVLRFSDTPREESKPFLHHLGVRHNIREVILLSGDRPTEVSVFASGMGIAKNYGGQSPEEKLEIVREVTARSRTLYLGDGINDAPAMMNATAGVALGVNSDITSEAAGAVILQGSLTGVDELIHIGRRMRKIALTSAVGGMALSMVGMAAASAGLLAPIEGAILQEIIDLLAILNSLRMILPTDALSDFHLPQLKLAADKAQPLRSSGHLT